MPLRIVRDNIINMYVDVIVNSANPNSSIGSGVDYFIHKFAGTELLEERKKIGFIKVGEAKITSAYNLKAEHVIHTVGPKWIDGKHNEEDLLSSCYRNSLHLAKEYGCTSIAFPLISSGNYGIPKDIALSVATNTIQEFLFENEMNVYLVVYDKNSYQLSKQLSNSVKSYIDENYIHDIEKCIPQFFSSRNICEEYFEYFDEEDCLENAVIGTSFKPELSLEEMMEEMEDTFSEALWKWIIKKDLNEVTVYKKANMDRRLFSKIKNNKDYKPSKINAIALAIALELDLEETKQFIGKAGYSLTHSNKFDIIIEFFIINKKYNVFDINGVLFYYNQPTI